MMSRLSFGHIVMITAGLVAFLLNLLILRSKDETSEVLAASQPIASGMRIAPEHLKTVHVVMDEFLSGRLMRPDQADHLLGMVSIHNIAGGSPLFLEDFRWESNHSGSGIMSVPIEPSHAAAADLRPGDIVDVVSVVEGSGVFAARRIEVLTTAQAKESGFSPGGDFSVTVAVDDASALAIAAALTNGAVYLVRSTNPNGINTVDQPEDGT